MNLLTELLALLRLAEDQHHRAPYDWCAGAAVLVRLTVPSCVTTCRHQAYLMSCQFEIVRVVSMMLDRHLDLMLSKVLPRFHYMVDAVNDSDRVAMDEAGAKVVFDAGVANYDQLAFDFDAPVATDDPTAHDSFVSLFCCVPPTALIPVLVVCGLTLLQVLTRLCGAATIVHVGDVSAAACSTATPGSSCIPAHLPAVPRRKRATERVAGGVLAQPRGFCPQVGASTGGLSEDGDVVGFTGCVSLCCAVVPIHSYDQVKERLKKLKLGVASRLYVAGSPRLVPLQRRPHGGWCGVFRFGAYRRSQTRRILEQLASILAKSCPWEMPSERPTTSTTSGRVRHATARLRPLASLLSQWTRSRVAASSPGGSSNGGNAGQEQRRSHLEATMSNPDVTDEQLGLVAVPQVSAVAPASVAAFRRAQQLFASLGVHVHCRCILELEWFPDREPVLRRAVEVIHGFVYRNPRNQRLVWPMLPLLLHHLGCAAEQSQVVAVGSAAADWDAHGDGVDSGAGVVATLSDTLDFDQRIRGTSTNVRPVHRKRRPQRFTDDDTALAFEAAVCAVVEGNLSLLRLLPAAVVPLLVRRLTAASSSTPMLRGMADNATVANASVEAAFQVAVAQLHSLVVAEPMADRSSPSYSLPAQRFRPNVMPVRGNQVAVMRELVRSGALWPLEYLTGPGTGGIGFASGAGPVNSDMQQVLCARIPALLTLMAACVCVCCAYCCCCCLSLLLHGSRALLPCAERAATQPRWTWRVWRCLGALACRACRLALVV